MTVQEQTQVFVWMIVCGAALGAVYDALCAMRCVLHARRVLTGILDVFYGLCCGSVVVITALRLQVQAYRLYVFLGIGTGMAVYAGVIGMPVRILNARIRKCVKKSRMVEEKYPNDAGKWKDLANK